MNIKKPYKESNDKSFIEKMSDENLVVLVCTKNQELYEEIVKRYQNKLLRYVKYLIKDQHKSEDVVQETFIKAFINLRGFNTKKKFSSWIYRIAHNEAINNVKKYKKEVFLSEKGWAKNSFAHEESIHQKISDKEIKEYLKNCLSGLPLKYREPITLFYLEEKSYKEISNILRLSVGGVGARINRAKKILKILCKEKFNTKP